MVTDREVFRELIAEAASDVVVFETCTAAGWLAYVRKSAGVLRGQSQRRGMAAEGGVFELPLGTVL